LSHAHGKALVCALLALAGVAPGGARAATERIAMAPVPSTFRYTCLNDLARRLNARIAADEVTGVWALEAGGRRVAVAPGLAAATLGARFVSLRREVVSRYGRVYVPRRLARDIERYLRAKHPEQGPTAVTPRVVEPGLVKLGPRPVARVCIDPGHGGRDPGAVSRWGLREKDVVLPTAKLLAAELRRLNFETVLTRETDRFLELEDRPAVATRKRADVFVSVHANAIAKPSYHGIEIFYWYGSRPVATVAVRRASVALAEAIRRACVRNGLGVRSVRGANYRVLRYSRVPAVLVEIGFLTNRAEERALRTTAYRQRVARAIAEGIAAYRKGSR